MTIHCQVNEPTIDIYISLLRQLAENSDEVFWMATPDQKRIIYISPACTKVWDCTPDSLYTNAHVWLDNIHLADRERVVSAFEDRVAGKFDEQYRLMRSNDSISWVWSRAFPIRDKSGQVLGIVGISEDITERTQTQDERLYQALHSRINGLAALSSVSQIISSTLDLDEMLTLITDIATRLLNAAATSVLLRMEEQDDLFFAAASGEASDYIVGKSLALGSGIGGWVIQHGQPILTADVSQDPRFLQSFDQAT
ncbi:MAG TPA: PAS domain-containing protein, partial [Anaerolineae bacterium]